MTDSEGNLQRQRHEECLRQVASYQGQFPDVPTMTSNELVKKICSEKDNILLVDVRTQEEQDASMIPGALRLKDVDLSEQMKDEESKMLVIYCTVGYRSGREARRLQQLHPEWKGRIYNLDGILAYSHVQDAPPLVTTMHHDTDSADAHTGSTDPADTSS
ncbi:MAG: hypothetical protein SGARI_002602, partial [Bacillariaceae sp.]